MAIKQLSMNLPKTQDLDKFTKVLTNELVALNSFSHENVLKLIDLRLTTSHVYTITEFCNGGTLEDIKKDISVIDSLSAIKQIAKGMHYVHSRKIIHRNLKPSNILINEGIMKIADFQISKTVAPDDDIKMTSKIGDPSYMAPEVCNGENYDSKCDIWSVGVIFYELIYKKIPWDVSNPSEDDMKQKYEKLVLPDIPEYPECKTIKPQYIQDLMTHMLHFRTNERFDFQEVFEHDVFTNEIPNKLVGKKK